MKVDFEKVKGGMRLHFEGETHTFVNLLRSALWDAGADGAAYRQEHPLKEELTLLVQGKSPKKLLKKAANLIEKDASALQRHASDKL